MRFLGRSLVALFLFAFAAGLLGWAGQITLSALDARGEGGGGGPPARERVLAANVLTAKLETVAPTLTAFGEIRARRVFELRAPVAGRVVELAEGFEEGGRVAEGQLLLRIDPAGAEAAVAIARADLAGAEAELRDAERGLALARDELAGAERQRDLQRQALGRQQDLAQRGVGSIAAVETAELTLSAAEQTILTQRGAAAREEARIDTATLAIDRARIAVTEAERDLSDRMLRAEFAGQLTDVSVLRGGLVSANEKIATLIDPRALEVTFRLSAAQHARLLDGAGDMTGAGVRAVLDVQGIDLAARGTITREAASVGEGQTGRLVFATLEDAQGFRPGDFVRIEVQEPPLAEVIRLPSTAVSALESVLALGPGERLEEIPVVLLRRQGDDVLVTGDIGGRDIVAERSPALGSGIRVRPVRPGIAEPEVLDVVLDPERRARLRAVVEANERIPAEMKARMLTQLEAETVPAAMVESIESRMGG